jgi:hypothetical protein
MYLQSLKSANHKKEWVHKSQISKVSNLRKVHKSNELLSPQICGFVICRTYFRTVHLWSSKITYSMLNSMYEYEVVLGLPILLLQFSPWDFEHSTCLIVVFNSKAQ